VTVTAKMQLKAHT